MLHRGVYILYREGLYILYRGGGGIRYDTKGVYIYHTGGGVYIYTIQEGVFVNILYWGRLYTAQCVPKNRHFDGAVKIDLVQVGQF